MNYLVALFFFIFHPHLPPLAAFKCVVVFPAFQPMIYLINWLRKSMGSGKMMVEFFSAEMVLRVCAD